jgi:hypothetical protein
MFIRYSGARFGCDVPCSCTLALSCVPFLVHHAEGILRLYCAAQVLGNDLTTSSVLVGFDFGFYSEK